MLKKIIYTAATIFLAVLFLAILGQALLPIAVAFMPPSTCDIAMSENEIRKLIVDEINTRGLHTYFPKNVASLKPEDGNWRILSHSREEIGSDTYIFMKYEVSFKYENQEIISYIGSCANIDRIYNKSESY